MVKEKKSGGGGKRKILTNYNEIDLKVKEKEKIVPNNNESKTRLNQDGKD